MGGSGDGQVRGQAGEGRMGFPSPVSIGLHCKRDTHPTQLAAVRMEGIKGEVTVMSKAACFTFSLFEDKYICWLRSCLRPLPDSNIRTYVSSGPMDLKCDEYD